MQSISDIRKEYTKSLLDVSTVDKDPIKQFSHWFQEALDSDAAEPNAMTLSTISASGTPASRIVLLKGVEDRRLVFYTNYLSQKGKELALNPACALNFFWPELERQVRITGIATKIEDAISEKYFQSRPRKSQIGAWASPQSAPIASREILEKREQEMEKRFEGKKVLPKPHQWGGYAVMPVEMEFWQGRPGRLHDRIAFTKVDGTWKVNRLAP